MKKKMFVIFLETTVKNWKKKYLLNIFASNSSNQHFTAISRVLPINFIYWSHPKKKFLLNTQCV